LRCKPRSNKRAPAPRPTPPAPQVPFTRVVYIEATDFRLQDSKDYYGLAPGKSAMLRWVGWGVV